MKRLTVRNREGEAAVLGYASSADIMDKLARYEDTGVEPEELQEVVACLGAACEAVPEELKSWAERCLWHVRKCDELRRELNEAGALRRKVEHAELEGRLWVLPVPLGAVLWRVAEIGAKLVLEPLTVERIELLPAGVQLGLYGAAERLELYDAEYIGSELFLTPAEAAEELMRRQTSRSFRATDDEGAAAGEPCATEAVESPSSGACGDTFPANPTNAAGDPRGTCPVGEGLAGSLSREGGEGQSLVHPQTDARRPTYTLKCSVCGREFEAASKQATLCGAECKAARKREQARRYYAENADALRRKAKSRKKNGRGGGAEKGGMSVEEIAREAKEAGMSYGEYVRWLEEQAKA